MEEIKNSDNQMNEVLLNQVLENTNIEKDHAIIEKISNKDGFNELGRQILNSNELTLEQKSKLYYEHNDKYRESYQKSSDIHYKNKTDNASIILTYIGTGAIIGGTLTLSFIHPKLAKNILAYTNKFLKANLRNNNTYIDVA